MHEYVASQISITQIIVIFLFVGIRSLVVLSLPVLKKWSGYGLEEWNLYGSGPRTTFLSKNYYLYLTFFLASE